jgi:uncharacterized membrane protein YecN with MAPEG domain
MEISNISLLTITPIYIALLGILFIPFTMRVGLYRVKNKINLGDGQDEKLIKLARGQGNFIESVPLAVVLLLVMEVLGAGSVWLHTLGVLLVGGRSLHYLGITGLGHLLCRPVGMLATLSVYLVSSVWILLNLLA